jgi:hypothetical protein
MNTLSRVRRRVVATAVVTLFSIPLTSAPALAGVIQQVRVDVTDQSDSDIVFGITGDDITSDIRASVTNPVPPPGSPSGAATGAVNQFGALGVSVGGSGIAVSENPHNAVSARVLIGSDDFLNSTGQIQTVVASAIIDGGRLRLIGARNLQISYELTVGMLDLGVVPPASQSGTLLNTDRALGISVGPGSVGVFQTAGGMFKAADDGSLSLTTFGGGLAATLDADASTVEIPISVQSFVLGPVRPAGRIHVGYEFVLKIAPVRGKTATFDRAFANYSDPLNLSGNPAFQVSFQPIPEPSAAVLAALAGFASWRRASTARKANSVRRA